MKKFVYKVIDSSGRVNIPKSMRDEAGISIGDIVKVSVDTENNEVKVSRFDFIDLSEESSEKTKRHIMAAIEHMSSEKKVEVATSLLGSCQKSRKEKGEKKK